MSEPRPGAERAGGTERAIVLSYAPSGARDGLAALLALDDTLGDILRSTQQPMIGQMRLTWWHDALLSLGRDRAPAQPVLQALAAHVIPAVPVETLAGMVEGWEELLDSEPLDADRLRRFAHARGGGLFAAARGLLGCDERDPIAVAGRGWALADLAAHVGDAGTAALARSLAQPLLDEATRTRWSRNGRSLGAMAHWAARPDASPPARAARALWHRLTGR